MASHLESQSLDFLQFSFRWVNCLLIREIPFEQSVRLWDTYMAEGSRFSEFLVSATATHFSPNRDLNIRWHVINGLFVCTHRKVLVVHSQLVWFEPGLPGLQCWDLDCIQSMACMTSPLWRAAAR